MITVKWRTTTTEEWTASFTVEQVAEELQMSVEQVRECLADGTLKGEWSTNNLLPGMEGDEPPCATRRTLVQVDDRWITRISKA